MAELVQGVLKGSVLCRGLGAVSRWFSRQWQKSAVHVLTTKKTYALEPAGYENMLERVIASVETGQAQTAPVEDILESILIMLAGRISRARGGARVALAEIPPEDPGFDGDAFEREYAASAKPLYAQ